MNIVTINSAHSGGAWVAAKRLHQSLLADGHTGSFLTLEPQADGVTIALDQASLTPGTPPFWGPHLLNRWNTLAVSEKLHEGGCDLFTDVSVGLHELSSVAQESIAVADVVHLHWVAGVLAAPELYSLLVGKKIVWTLHDMNPFTGGCHYHLSCRSFEVACGNCPLLPEASPLDRSHKDFLLKQELYRDLDLHIVTPSQWLADMVASSSLLGDRPITVVPNAHDTDFFRPLDRKALRRDYGFADDQFVLLLGSEYLQNSRKGIDLVEKALRTLAVSNPNAPLEILAFGSGTFPEVGFPVKVMGMVDAAKMVELYNVADVFIHPSSLDNLSNTLCEAQCCGTPVLCFDVGGNKEAFIPGETGFLIPQYTAEELIVAISMLLDNINMTRSMRETARLFALDKYSPKRISAAYTEVYKRHKALQSVRTPNVKTLTFLKNNHIITLSSSIREIGINQMVNRLSIQRIEDHLRNIEIDVKNIQNRLEKKTFSSILKKIRRGSVSVFHDLYLIIKRYYIAIKKQ